MTQFNQIGESGLSEILTRRLTTPGGTNAPSCAPEIFPTLVLENDRPEWLHLSGAARFARFTAAAAGGAGVRSSISLVNSTERTLAVVELVHALSASGVPQVSLITNPVGAIPFGTQSRGSSLDSRFRAAGTMRLSSLVVVSDNTLASAAAPLGFAGSTTELRVETPFVLAPGSRLYVFPNADNVALNGVTFVWRERGIEPGELV